MRDLLNKKRKTYSAGFKTKVVLEVRQERETVREKITPHHGDNLNWMTYQRFTSER